VTGASRGIGRAIALAFRAEGSRVIGTRTAAPAEGDDACDEYVVADFSEMDQACACAKAIRDLAPDVLVNNAGINKIAPFAEIAPADFLRIQQVNVVAPFLFCQAAIPAMRERGWGRIVNLSSIWGKVGKEFRASYSASKFAIDGLTLALAVEHGADGILANCVAPGFTNTELTRRVLGEAGIAAVTGAVPVRRMGSVEEIANLVLWLGGPLNTYVTGQNIAIDGGFVRA
jgi:3-oxoacyl-[acyl-carrier protein] reductase